MSCTFCDAPERTGDVVFEDAQTWVVLHEDWSPRGHAMVVSKQHVENASSLGVEAWQHLTAVWHHAEQVLLSETGAARAFILKLGIMTPHLHMHIYPMGADTTRAEVFAAFDGAAQEPRDEAFVERVRSGLRRR